MERFISFRNSLQPHYHEYGNIARVQGFLWRIKSCISYRTASVCLMPCPSGLRDDLWKPGGVFDADHLESPGRARGEGTWENILGVMVEGKQCVVSLVCYVPEGRYSLHPSSPRRVLVRIPCSLCWAATRVESALLGSFCPALLGTLQQSFRMSSSVQTWSVFSTRLQNGIFMFKYSDAVWGVACGCLCALVIWQHGQSVLSVSLIYDFLKFLSFSSS